MAMRALLLLALFPLACAKTPAPPPAASTIAPPPFSAEQIRDATPQGRSYTFKEWQGEGAPTLRKITFHAPDAKGVGISSKAATSTTTAAPHRVSWAELVGHASYPAAQTQIEDAEVQVPAGRFRARHYTVRTPTPKGLQETDAWFAVDLPGAPVQHEVRLNGRRVSRMQLVAYWPSL